jgi:hypothetical protein
MNPALRSIIMPGYCPEAIAFFQRTSGLTSSRKRAYDKMIRALVACGVWAQLDAFWVFATHNSTTALLNLKSSLFPGTANGSPTFAADGGYTGVNDSTTVYIDTGFNASTASAPKFTQNSAHVGVWANTDVTPTGTGGSMMGLNAGDSSYRTRIILRNPSNVGAGSANADNTSATFSSASDARGSGICSRTASGTQVMYLNGVATAQVTTNSSAVLNDNIYVLALRLNGTGPFGGSAAQISMASIGGGLTAAQVAAFHAAQRQYMQTIAGIIY